MSGDTIARVKLKDGKEASISFLSKKDSTAELLKFINRIIAEKAYLFQNKKFTLVQEEEWKAAELEKYRRGEGFQLIARVDGKIAGSSGAGREMWKGSGNILIGIAIAKPFRRLGLGELLISINIKTAKKLFRPKNIYLSVLRANKPAHSLYKKLGFKEFAVFPKWMNHYGKYIDQIFMKI